MKDYLNKDSRRKEILEYQINTLKPNIVMCGGTFEFACDIFGSNIEVFTKTFSNGKTFKYFCYDKTVFVGCYHPSRPGWSRKDSYQHVFEIFVCLFD